MITWLKRILIGLTVLIATLFYALFLSPRPDNQTDPAVLAGDGSVINYCELPKLDGSGLNAVDIPKGNTPGCLYEHFPWPILSQCTEPLAQGAGDIRGLWQSEDGDHVERVEQCGSRVVITTAGIIHDGGPNATGGLNSNDTEGTLFRAFGKDFCPRTSASMTWELGDNGEPILNFRPFGIGPVAVSRYRDGEQLVWRYINGTVTRMNRICTLPKEHKTPNR